MKIAVLITVYNRVEMTLRCLGSLFACALPYHVSFEVYLVDDGSTDRTKIAVETKYPQVKLINGSGSLFWAGGMRLAYSHAKNNNFDGYLLLNDDTLLFSNAFDELFGTHNYSLAFYKKQGICIGSTKDPESDEFSYGGYKLRNSFTSHSKTVFPDFKNAQKCDMANANIMLVPNTVIDAIGWLDPHYTHSLADFDFTLKASKNKIPVLICPNYCGTCKNDHKKNWLTSYHSFKERVLYLKDTKRLAYKEYFRYMRVHFPLYWPVSIIMLWAKTLFPVFWEKFKK